MSDGRTYSDHEVREIIDRALASASGEGGLSHPDLLAVGEQVGISAEAMTRAALEVREAKLDGAATGAVTSRRRRWLAAHAGLFALINGLLFTVNFLTTPGEWWALFPIFFWGLALALHAAATFAAPVSPRALQRERRRIAEQGVAGAQRLRVAASAEPVAAVVEEAPSADADVSRARAGRRA